MNELFALLDFTPHPLHLILVGFQRYHLFIRLQLILHLRDLTNKNQMDKLIILVFFQACHIQLHKKGFADEKCLKLCHCIYAESTLAV